MILCHYKKTEIRITLLQISFQQNTEIQYLKFLRMTIGNHTFKIDGFKMKPYLLNINFVSSRSVKQLIFPQLPKKLVQSILNQME